MARINHGHLASPDLAATSVAARRQRGFSLIELLIVVAIILIIAAIAIPNFMRARMSANEAAAVHSLRTVTTAQVTYSTMFSVGYADTLTKLGGLGAGPVTVNSAHILDWLLGCASQPCLRSGYNFNIESTTGTPPADYKATAIPLVLHTSGDRGFCSSQATILSVDPAGASNCTQPLK
jgi:type IV pilus assembly protein PilA